MTNGQKAVLMDGFRLYINTAGLTNIFDFDGSNPQVLAPAIDNTGVYFNRDFSSYYSLALSTANPGQTLVTKTNLRLP